MSKEKWDEVVSALHVYGYVDPPVVENPPTVFCTGEFGAAVVRPGKKQNPPSVVLMIEGGNDLAVFASPTIVLEQLAKVIGNPAKGDAMSFITASQLTAHEKAMHLAISGALRKYEQASVLAAAQALSDFIDEEELARFK